VALVAAVVSLGAFLSWARSIKPKGTICSAPAVTCFQPPYQHFAIKDGGKVHHGNYRAPCKS
jgi:hypothetical protein